MIGTLNVILLEIGRARQLMGYMTIKLHIGDMNHKGMQNILLRQLLKHSEIVRRYGQEQMPTEAKQNKMMYVSGHLIHDILSTSQQHSNFDYLTGLLISNLLVGFYS